MKKEVYEPEVLNGQPHTFKQLSKTVNQWMQKHGPNGTFRFVVSEKGRVQIEVDAQEQE